MASSEKARVLDLLRREPTPDFLRSLAAALDSDEVAWSGTSVDPASTVARYIRDRTGKPNVALLDKSPANVVDLIEREKAVEQFAFVSETRVYQLYFSASSTRLLGYLVFRAAPRNS